MKRMHFAALMLVSLPAVAQDSAATGPLDGSAVEQRLSEMGESLREIAAALTAATRQQEVGVLMTRIQLKQHGLTPLETELRAARGERESVGDERQRIEALVDDWERALRSRDPGEPEPDSMQLELRHARGELELLDRRQETLDLRIVELENDLARLRKDILVLEDQVDERLGLR